MVTPTLLISQQSPLDSLLPGCWKLGAGRALTLQPREDGVLRVAHGRMWVTFDGPHSGHGNESGDHFLAVGEQLTLQAGRRVVVEPWGAETEAPAYFSWDALPARLPHPVREASRWQLAVVQPLADLRLALLLGLGAVGRLGTGLAGVAIDLVARRGRPAWTARAFNAQSSA